MIVALDTSSLVAFLGGSAGADVDSVDDFLSAGTIMLPPVVLLEVLSDPKLPAPLIRFIKNIPTLEVLGGYWERCALLRAKIMSKSLKARLGDTLIAQSCIDHELPLITRDRDFRHYARYGGLTLYQD